MLSYYQILQVNENETSDNIKKAYRKLSKILHPDLHNNTKEANVIFNLLHEAYETLYDPIKRKNYNPKLHLANSLNVSSEDYAALVATYKRTVNDYEQIIRIKTKRERELLNEIKELKSNKLAPEDLKFGDGNVSLDSKSKDQDIKSDNKKSSTLKKEKRVNFWIIGLKILGVLLFISLGVFIAQNPLLIILLIVIVFIIIPVYKIFKG